MAQCGYPMRLSCVNRSNTFSAWAVMLPAVVTAQVALPAMAADDIVYRIASPAGPQPFRPLRADKAALQSKAGYALARM